MGLRQLSLPTVLLHCISIMVVLGALGLTGFTFAQDLDTVPEFEDKGDFKAIARAGGDEWGASWNHCSIDSAIQTAIHWCKESQKTYGNSGECRTTRVGDMNVSGLQGQAWTERVEHYREAVESEWLARTRKSGYAIEVLAYGGQAQGWDEFIEGMVRFDPKGICLTDIEGNGVSIRCKGYGRFAGRLREDSEYPVYGENLLTCTNGQTVKGESVSLEPGVGFTCLITPNGGRVMVIFGPGSHALVRTREAFLEAYHARVAASGLDRELCGWGLLS